MTGWVGTNAGSGTGTWKAIDFACGPGGSGERIAAGGTGGQGHDRDPSPCP